MTDIGHALRDRYTLVRELGQGGMATVYLAEDLKHHRRVAVKVLRPGIAEALGAARFLREIEVAAGLTHPHILPLHDSGAADGHLYYVMPYIEGESLRARLQRAGRLPVDEAVRILRDVADALASAHQRGVVHRDIKPDNVMLSGRHALVMDFGVAKAVTEATGQETITSVGMIVGTPAYMAPEQIVADPSIDHRVDLYALGVLGYELLAGHPPFRGSGPHQVLGAHIGTAPEPLALHRPDAPSELAALVMRCLAKDPAERPQSAQEVLTALEAIPASTGTAAPTLATTGRPERRPRSRWAALAAVTLALAGASVAGAMLWRRDPGPDPRRVAVAVFGNETGEPALDPLGRMAADWLTQGLAQTEMLEVVPSSAGVNADPATSAAPEPDRVAALGEATGAGTVVWGTYYRQGDSLRFQAQVSDVRRRTLLRAFEPVTGAVVRPSEVVDRLRQRVTAGLATMFDPQLAALSWNTIEPPTFDAYREFMLGLEQFYRFDFPAALDSWARAEALDSTSSQSTRNHAALWAAVALDNLNRRAEADSVLRVLNGRRQRLTRLERASLDWQLTRLRGDRSGALEAARRVHEVTPGSDLSELMHGFTATEVNRPAEGLAALAQIDEGVPQAIVWYWSNLTDARHMLGEHERELADARRGWRRAPSTATLLNELRALAALGRTTEVHARLEEGTSVPQHPFATPGYVMEVAALELRAHGHAAAAGTAAERALTWYRTRPKEERRSETHQFDLARVLYFVGRWSEATTAFEPLAAAHPDSASYLGFIGTSAVRQGKRREAERILAVLASLKYPHVRGAHTYWRARIAALLGRREEATSLLREAFQQGLVYSPELHTVIDFESLREYPPYVELLRPKG